MNELVLTLKKQTEVMFTNAEIMLKTCDLNFVLCDMPIWKHVYHALHYSLARISDTECELNNLCVAPDFRHNGVEKILNTLKKQQKKMILS